MFSLFYQKNVRRGREGDRCQQLQGPAHGRNYPLGPGGGWEETGWPIVKKSQVWYIHNEAEAYMNMYCGHNKEERSNICTHWRCWVIILTKKCLVTCIQMKTQEIFSYTIMLESQVQFVLLWESDRCDVFPLKSEEHNEEVTGNKWMQWRRYRF